MSDWQLAAPRIAGAAVGPVLSMPVVYDPRSSDAEMGAVGKNLSEQIPHKHDDVLAWMVIFLVHFAAGCFDAGRYRLHFPPASREEVLAAAYKRSGAKGRAYQQASDWFYRGVGFCKVFTIFCSMHVASMFVKVEALAFGKPPRMIYNPLTWEVIVGLESTRPAEYWMKSERVTFKGVPTSDKHLPIAEAALKVDRNFDVFVLCLDDTGRDGNTVTHDFGIFTCVLAILGSLTSLVADFLERVGFTTRMHNFTLIGRWLSLLSGSPWTSVMNYFTSMFVLFCFAQFYLGLNLWQYYCLAEGDDSALIISGTAARLLIARGMFDEDKLAAFGLKLRKRIKVESARWFYDPAGHPIVGGVAVFGEGGGLFIPSWKRFLQKSSWALSFMIDVPAVYLSRLQSRSLCLNDRFTTVPVMWAYARRVRQIAQRQGGRVCMSSQELYAYSGNDFAQPPSMEARLAFAGVCGISVSHQYAMESYIFQVSDYHDLSTDSYWQALL